MGRPATFRPCPRPSPTASLCPDCSAPQFLCGGGVTCRNGHGYGEWSDRPLVGSEFEKIRQLREAENATDDANVVDQRVGRRDNTEGSVTATFGREVYRLADYTSVEVGPFAVTVSINPGESIEDALERAQEQVDQFGLKQRDKKLVSYKAKLVELQQRRKGGT